MPEIPLRLRLALFPPCHPEQRRNPSETRIERCVASFGISAEKVRLRLRSAQNDTGGTNADGKGVLKTKFNKKLSLFEHTPRVSYNRDNSILSEWYSISIEKVLSLL